MRTTDIEGPFTRSRLGTLVLLAVTAILLYLIYQLALPFAAALSWGFALAIVAWPIHAWIARHVRKPGLSASLSVTVVALVLVVPVVLVSTYTFRQAQDAIQKVRSPETRQKWEQFEREHPRVGKVAGWARQQVYGNGGQGGGASAVGSKATDVVSGTVRTLVQALIALFALFFFFRDRDQILGFVRGLLPLTQAEERKMFKTVHDTVHATVYGHVGVALIQGALGGLMFWFLGIPGPLLWGVVMGLLAIIPVLGAFVVWAPAAIYLALSGHMVKAGILVVWGTLVVGTIDNVLYPMFVGGRLRLHTLPVFLAIVGGLSVFGTAGIVLGPLVLAIFLAVIEVWKQRTRGGRSAEEQLEPAKG